MKQAHVAAARARTIREIRARRAAGKPKRRRRIPRGRYPKPIEREYARAIGSLVSTAHAAVAREITPQIAGWVAEFRSEMARGDHVDAGLPAKIAALIRRVAGAMLDAIRPTALQDLADRFAARTARWSKDETNRQVRAAVGVDIFTAEPNLVPIVEGFVAENVALIRTVPAKYFEQVEGVVLRGVTSGTPPKDIAAQLAEQEGVAERRAALIARDQVGKLYGRINEARQQRLGVKHFVWRTVNDNRVRPEHEEREGNTYSWTAEDATDDAPFLGDEELPGQPINCRCTGEPVLDDLLEGL